MRMASAATIAIVVFLTGVLSDWGGSMTARFPCRPNSASISRPISQGRPVAGLITRPSELTATRAAVVIPESSIRLAVPSPPLILPDHAPVPAPTLPISTGLLAAAWQAFSPHSALMGGMKSDPRSRSYRTAAGTIGATYPLSSGKPKPFLASQRTTPSAAAKPNTEPPESTTACACCTKFAGASKSVSRVPGADPRTSTPVTAPSEQIATVKPLAATVSV